MASESFGEALHGLRGEHSLREVARRANVNNGHLSRMARGTRRPTMEFAVAIDRAFDTGGRLAALLAEAQPKREVEAPAPPWETAELLQRLRANSVDSVTIEAMHATAYELCCQYPTREAGGLRAEAHGWLEEITRLLHQPVGLNEHKELLVASGWLALLTGCLEADLGMRAGAEATRIAARELGRDAGHSEIVGWSHEMSAWFALTQARYGGVLTAAREGQAVAAGGSAAVQLMGQEAKALARMGDIDGVSDALDRGRTLLDSMPRPYRREHHFVVDPDKWDFYAMDAYRTAGDDERAAVHARRVLELGAAPEGERAPMRMTEARLTLAAIAARGGDLEQAVTTGIGALGGQRKSLPTLLMVAGELDNELHQRYPGEVAADDFREALHAVKAVRPLEV